MRILCFLGEIGVATLKLSDWENIAEIHEAAPTMDNRKQTTTKYVVLQFVYMTCNIVPASVDDGAT